MLKKVTHPEYIPLFSKAEKLMILGASSVSDLTVCFSQEEIIHARIWSLKNEAYPRENLHVKVRIPCGI